MIDISPAFRALAPAVDACARAEWIGALMPAMASGGLATPKRAAMFLGQCCKETAAFTRLEENLHYSTAERIHAVWPTEFPSAEDAEPYVGLPELLANRVYANRLGNGDQASGDGWRFRGRGLIQVTGRGQYEACATALGVPVADLPDLMTTPRYAALSAVWWWNRHPQAMAAADRFDIYGATRIVNGSETDLIARCQACNLALAVLSAVEPPAPVAQSTGFTRSPAPAGTAGT